MVDNIIVPVAECPVVKGCKRSIIYDLSRTNFNFIPNDLYFLLNKYAYQSINDIKKDYPIENYEIIDEYFKFLLDNEYIFFCDKNDKDFFSKIDFQFEEPNKISNAIICISQYTFSSIREIIKQLEDLNCKYIQLIFYDFFDLENTNKILSYFDRSIINAIDLYFTTCNLSNEVISNIVKGNLRIRSFVIFNSTEDKIITPKEQKSGIIAYNSSDINLKELELIKNIKYYFNVNVELFSEAQKYNVYYNKKISIDYSGKIKNCISNEKNFGNITNTKLSDIIEDKKFNYLWNINKDKIETCKDCEFRYMCIDPRIPERNTKNCWKCKSECRYNPYIAKWEGEDGYVTVNNNRSN